MTNQVDLKCLPASYYEIAERIAVDEYGGKKQGDFINYMRCPKCGQKRMWTHTRNETTGKEPMTFKCNRDNNCQHTISVLKEHNDQFPKDPNYKPPPKQKEENLPIINDGTQTEKVMRMALDKAKKGITPKIIDRVKKEAPTNGYMEYKPMSEGIIADIENHIIASEKIDDLQIIRPMVLNFLGSVFAGRVIHRGTMTNLYNVVMNGSGQGKTVLQNEFKAMEPNFLYYYDEKGEFSETSTGQKQIEIIGPKVASHYAVMKSIQDNPTRLFYFDEGGSLFKGDALNEEIIDFYTDMWSQERYYKGVLLATETKKKKIKHGELELFYKPPTGAVSYPALGLAINLTVEDFHKNITQENLDKGFLGRAIFVFSQKRSGEKNYLRASRNIDRVRLNRIKEFIKHWSENKTYPDKIIERPSIQAAVFGRAKCIPTEIEIENSAFDYWCDIIDEIEKEKTRAFEENWKVRPIVNRKAQNLAKFVQIHTCARVAKGVKPIVTKKDIDNALYDLSVFFNNACIYFGENLHRAGHGKLVSSIIRFLNDGPKNTTEIKSGVTGRNLGIVNTLKELESDGVIEAFQMTNPATKRSAKYYTLSKKSDA